MTSKTSAAKLPKITLKNRECYLWNNGSTTSTPTIPILWHAPQCQKGAGNYVGWKARSWARDPLIRRRLRWAWRRRRGRRPRRKLAPIATSRAPRPATAAPPRRACAWTSRPLAGTRGNHFSTSSPTPSPPPSPGPRVPTLKRHRSNASNDSNAVSWRCSPLFQPTPLLVDYRPMDVARTTVRLRARPWTPHFFSFLGYIRFVSLFSSYTRWQ